MISLINQYHRGYVTLEQLQSFEFEMNKPVEYNETTINEIEKIQLVFAKFFTGATDSSDLDIQPKKNNIYNMSEIQAFANRELIIKNLMAAKVVMMLEEEGDRNWLHYCY